MSIAAATAILITLTIFSGLVGGTISAIILRKGILADIRAEKAGDLAE